MNCKSCSATLNNNDIYCSRCGAKDVNERLSLKGTWKEFIGPFFNWDNNFWNTFKDMIISPQNVFEAYISGARKKYFNPFSFLIIYGTIALVFYKFFPVTDLGEMFAGMESEMKANNTDNTPGLTMDGVLKPMFNNYNLVIILSVPFMALMSYFAFKKKGHNFSEHMVFQSYLQSMIGYLSLVLHVIVILLLKFDYSLYTSIYFIVMYIYANYVFYKYYKLKTKELLVANVKFTFYAIVVYAIIIIISALVGVFIYKAFMS